MQSPASGVRHAGPRLARFELAVLKQFYRNAVRRFHESHIPLARGAVHNMARVHDPLAGCPGTARKMSVKRPCSLSFRRTSSSPINLKKAMVAFVSLIRIMVCRNLVILPPITLLRATPIAEQENEHLNAFRPLSLLVSCYRDVSIFDRTSRRGQISADILR